MCPRPALEGALRGGEGKVQNGPNGPRCVGPREDAHLGSYLGTVPSSGAHNYGRGNDPIERATSEQQPFYCHARATTHARRSGRRGDPRGTQPGDLVDNEEVAAGDAQSSAALAAPVPVGLGLEATTETIPADLVAGEEAIGLHGIPPAQATETVAGLKTAQHEHVTTAGVQQADPEWLTALYCKLDEDGGGRKETALPTSSTPESLDHGQGSMTPGQQALHVARQCIQSSSMHTDAETSQVVRTLAVALGASRPEAGTIKALRAVVMLLEQPEMSEEEAYTSTGASMSNFKRWRKRVQSAQLGVSLP
eukprot:scaffold24650_cov82-Phaeocystis_antarctica.AAC.2